MKLTEAFNPFYSAIAVVILLAVSLLLYQKPYYNWDMFPYMALAINEPGIPFESVHARIYDSTSLSMPASDFEAVSARQPELKKNATAFQNVLKYYSIKPGFNTVVSLFYGLGVDLVAATYLPSILSYFVIGCLMMMWLGRMISPPFSHVITIVLMAFPFLFTTARFSSPDMLCAVLCFGGIFLVMESSVIWGLLLFLAAISVRPDAIILCLLLCMVLYKTKNLNLRQTVSFVLAGMVIILLILKSPELLKEYLYTTPSYSPSWNLKEMTVNYGISMQNGLMSILSSQIILFTTLALVTLYLRKKVRVELLSDPWSLIVIASLASVAIHYVLHPVVEDRFLIGNYLIIIMGFCKAISELFSTKPQRDEARKKTL